MPCVNTIERERRDSAILDKMLKERDAIFNWFLEGLHRLMNNNFKITRSKACEVAMNEYRSKLIRYIGIFQSFMTLQMIEQIWYQSQTLKRLIWDGVR